MKVGWNEYTQDLAKYERKTWVTKHPGQVVATISQVIWCQQTEQAINDMQDNPFALEDFYKENEKEISYLIDLVRGNLDSVRRKIIVALVTTDVHARDIIENLKNEKVESI